MAGLSCFLAIALIRATRWSKLLRPDKGDPTPDLFVPRDDFTFILITGNDELPEEAILKMAVIRVKDAEQESGCNKEDREDKELASLFGSTEVKRVSLSMVEAAFEGWDIGFASRSIVRSWVYGCFI